MLVLVTTAQCTRIPWITVMSPTLLNNEAAAAALGISPVTLKIWRCKGKGPRFIKLGEAKQAGVVYDPADIEAWKAARKFASTSAATVQYPATA